MHRKVTSRGKVGVSEGFLPTKDHSISVAKIECGRIAQYLGLQRISGLIINHQPNFADTAHEYCSRGVENLIAVLLGMHVRLLRFISAQKEFVHGGSMA